MDIILFIFTVMGAIATVISTFIAIRAKNEAKEILYQIQHNREVKNSGYVNVENSGFNNVVVSGINTGEINGKTN